jgi:hypothetical protein
VLCVQLGRLDEAKSQIKALVAEFPSNWLGKPTATFFVKLLGGYKNRRDTDIVIEALRKAGLPE